MRKTNKKRIVLAIILVILVIFEIIAFKNSRAEKTINLIANIIDNNNITENQEFELTAIDEGDSGSYISLPAEINGFKIKKYFIEEKSIDNTENKENNTIQEKLPGDEIYLTNEEKENKKIELKVEYDSKELDGEILYNKVLSVEHDSYNIKIEGFMPKAA